VTCWTALALRVLSQRERDHCITPIRRSWAWAGLDPPSARSLFFLERTPVITPGFVAY
jgi:hypothetical protein